MTFLKVKDLAAMLRTSTRSVWRLTATGKLPPPIYLGAKSPRWRLTEVEAALEKLK